MIVKPTEMDFSNKKMNIIIAGLPGIGKTTLALSAPRPLLIDADRGIDRVEAKYRKDTLIPESFDSIIDELKKTDLSNYETLVIDTGGALFQMIKDKVLADNPKARQSDGTMSLKGFGLAKKMFADFRGELGKFGKHVVFVFHAQEVVVDEDRKLTGLRIRIEGSSRDEVWDDIDLGGFMEMKGNRRTIGFGNCDRYYAKGTHQIHGVYEIPNLEKGVPNDFLAKLIDSAISGLQSETDELRKYDNAMSFMKYIGNCSTLEQCGKCIPALAKVQHALTSKDELWSALCDKAKELGGHYDKGTKQFVADNPEPAE